MHRLDLASTFTTNAPKIGSHMRLPNDNASPEWGFGCKTNVALRTGDRIVVCTALTENIMVIWEPNGHSQKERVQLDQDWTLPLDFVWAPWLCNNSRM